jgi:hypothetical protein
MLLFGIDVTHLDDRKNDGCVQVAFSYLSGMATVGTDGILDANQTFDLDKSVPVAKTQGSIKDGYLEFGPFDITLPVKIQDWDFPLDVHNAKIRMSISDDGALDGVMGGSVEVEDLIAKVTMYGIDDRVKQALPELVRNMADLDLDPASQKCRRFSMAATLSAKPAFIDQ